MALRGWISETWDRVVASDPGLQRLGMALSAAAAMSTTLGIEYEFARLTHDDTQGILVAMLLGTVIAMIGSMALTDTQVWPKVRTALFFPVTIGAGMLPGIVVTGHSDRMLAVFVVVMFVAVFIRRFGPAYFFYGFLLWMGYFFAVFLRARLADLPSLMAAVAVSTAWVLLLSLTVLRTNPRRKLRRVRRAFDARARAVARVCADLLQTDPADRRAQARTRRKLHSRQLRLAEAALIIEGWSGAPGALPQGWSAPALRRHLLDAHVAIDELAISAESLVLARGRLAAEAARIAGRLARRDYRAAEQLSRTLLALDQVRADHVQIGQAPAGGGTADADQDCFAQHLAAATLEFTALVAQADTPSDADDADDAEEFSPTVTLASGLLPGSPAVAGDVTARSSWNPLSRMSLTSRQAVQVAVAGTLAIVLGRQVSETRYYWALIATFVAFTGTATRSETSIKAGNRVLGTLLGLGAAVGLVHLTAGHTIWVLVAVVTSMACGFYVVGISYAGVIFFVTITVAQLYSVLHEFQPSLLWLRLEETAIGAAVGVAVALLVLPTSTRDTVRAARRQYFEALADLLRATVVRLGGKPPEGGGAGSEEPTDLEALIRTLDLRLRQLALVAGPLTRSLGRPLIWGNNPAVVHHRLTLHADLNRQSRALATAGRWATAPVADPELVEVGTALADAASALAAVAPDARHPDGSVALPLARAERLLLSLRPTDPADLPPVLAHVRWLLNELAVLPSTIPSPTPINAEGETRRPAASPAGWPGAAIEEQAYVGSARPPQYASAGVRPNGRAAQDPRFASVVEPPSVNGDGSAAEFGGIPVRGRVRGAGGAPLPGAAITLVEPGGRQLGRVRARDDGSYVLAVPGVGPYVLIAAADGHQPQAAMIMVGREPLMYELALSRASGLTGVVRNARTRDPIGAATVIVADLRGEFVTSAETDQNGTFSIKDLVSGPITLAVSADGYRPSAVPVKVDGRRTTHLDVELRAGARLKGRVRAGAGNMPLGDARVTLVNAAGDTVAVTTTGPDGDYTFTDLDFGEYTVTVSAYRPATATATVDGTDRPRIDLRLSHYGE